MSTAAKNAARILMMYRLELRKNDSTLKHLDDAYTKKKKHKQEKNSFVYHKINLLCVGMVLAMTSRSVLISLISLQSINVCFWRRPRRALRGRSPVPSPSRKLHSRCWIWMNACIHLNVHSQLGGKWKRYSRRRGKNNRMTQWPVVTDGSEGW